MKVDPEIPVERDPLSYGGEVESHKEIVLKAIEECRKQLSMDLREGGEYEVDTGYGTKKVYYPDQYQTNINSIKTLAALMKPKFNNTTREKIKEIQYRINNVHKIFNQKFLDLVKQQEDIDIKAGMTNPGYSDREKQNLRMNLNNDIKDFLMDQYREMFEVLIELFVKKNEFSKRHVISWDSPEPVIDDDD